MRPSRRTDDRRDDSHDAFGGDREGERGVLSAVMAHPSKSAHPIEHAQAIPASREGGDERAHAGGEATWPPTKKNIGTARRSTGRGSERERARVPNAVDVDRPQELVDSATRS